MSAQPQKRPVRLGRLTPILIFLFGLGLYVLTLAPSLVFGDPTEYTLMPHLGAILHPPGYAFMTVLVWLWQTLVPIGSLAYRSNLLSATAAALAGVLVYGAVTQLGPERKLRAVLAGVMAALSLYTASDVWQHALHTNAHIITALLAATSLFLLLQWRAGQKEQTGQNDMWLYTFGVVAGLSVTHHPLLAFGFPAYAVFILSQLWPRFTRKTFPIKTLVLLVVCGLLGLAPWLYFPIRSGLQPAPAFGPHDMNTLDGFLNLVLARGLTNVNLFHFGLAEQWHRLVVFGSLIQLQYAWPVGLLAGAGLVWLVRRDWRAALLLGLHLGFNLAFTLNTVQDVMAYLLVPLVSFAILIGAGVLAWGEVWQRWAPKVDARVAQAVWLAFPLFNLMWLAPRISLRDLHDADAYVETLAAYFKGRNEQAVVLSDWEHMTPLWYHEYVDGLQLDPNDVSVVYVNKPFVDAVWENIDKGPIYLLEYNPAVVATGFRLRAEGPFYRLEPPPATEPAQTPHPLQATYGPVTLVGYDVLDSTVQPGGVVPIILYVRAEATSDSIIHPYATLGDWQYRFTTDSHLLSNAWQAGEVIGERWEVTVPLNAAAGSYPLSVDFSDLTTGEDFGKPQGLGAITVMAGDAPVAETQNLAANFGQRVGVTGAWGWSGLGLQPQTAPWAQPLVVKPGAPIELRIQWQALQRMPDSYTVFVHLLAADNTLVASSDYTPLGGAWPTMLWFPKWLPGQAAVDPYTLIAPAEPGDYTIEMGLYGLRSVQRLAAYDQAGNLAGDRFVLGEVTVEP